MNRESIELGVLSSVRFLGWLNFIIFAIAFIGTKGASHQHLFVVYATFFVCCIGTCIYYFLYGRLFITITKKDGVTYFKPYRLGVFTMLCGVFMLYLLVYFNGPKT